VLNREPMRVKAPPGASHLAEGHVSVLNREPMRVKVRRRSVATTLNSAFQCSIVSR